MIVTVFKQVVIFFLLVLFQGLILNNIEFGSYVVPFLYVIFILALPFETPNWLVLIIGFVLGLTVDSFTNTLGMHTSATVIMAFCRAYVLKLIKPLPQPKPELPRFTGMLSLIFRSLPFFFS